MEKWIIVVDDDAANLKMASRILKSAGYRGSYFKSGTDFLTYMQGDKIPDLVLIDIHMPEMNGFELVDKIKENPKCKDLPFIFLTGDEEEETRERGFTVGAKDYLCKPLIPEVLINSLEKALS